MFEFLKKYDDVWFADADEIIRYYKARENITIGRVKKQGEDFLIELKNELPQYLHAEITLIQYINKKINKIQFTIDGKNYMNVEFKLIGKNVIMYNIPSNAKHILIS